MTNTPIKTIGVMSGTSLDGLDIAYCEFIRGLDSWNFEVGATETISFEDFFLDKLQNAQNLSGYELMKLNNEFGKWIGVKVKNFIKKEQLRPQLIASHGHTVFHEPENGLTFQIGSGQEIASITEIDTIYDFRSLDVSLGGQGAPLVPIGDKLLFKDYDYCLNLGGFANISFDYQNNRISYDIGPCNMALNLLASKTGLRFDKNGTLAQKGKINQNLLERLNNLEYFNKPYPKSLGREWFEEIFNPILEAFEIPIEDSLRTLVEHISMQIRETVGFSKTKKLLITGGGVHNKFLLNQIELNSNIEIVIPETKIVDFKEALIFAFLGVLRIANESNCLNSVTGAKFNSCGGVLVKAPNQ